MPANAEVTADMKKPRFACRIPEAFSRPGPDTPEGLAILATTPSNGGDRYGEGLMTLSRTQELGDRQSSPQETIPKKTTFPRGERPRPRRRQRRNGGRVPTCEFPSGGLSPASARRTKGRLRGGVRRVDGISRPESQLGSWRLCIANISAERQLSYGRSRMQRLRVAGPLGVPAKQAERGPPPRAKVSLNPCQSLAHLREEGSAPTSRWVQPPSVWIGGNETRRFSWRAWHCAVR